ncbi:MAG: sulfatase/phosphatase domain-containing protein [Saonia sp.]
MLSEGGIRVPFVVNWPAGISKGIVYDKAVIALDVAATCVALAGSEPIKELDGVNLIPYLNGTKSGVPHEALFWRFWDQSAIRMGDYKFLKAGNREYLFNLATSEHENKNLIAQYPEKAKMMKKRLTVWGSELQKPGISEDGPNGERKWYDHYFSLE